MNAMENTRKSFVLIHFSIRGYPLTLMKVWPAAEVESVCRGKADRMETVPKGHEGVPGMIDAAGPN